MKTIKTVPAIVSMAALLALSGYNCNDVLDDPGFDLWCGDKLCAWNLESGELGRVSTWHRSDSGVELIGSEVAISQFASRTSDNLRCLRFELIADIDETASVTLELDFYGDGVTDHAQNIPTSRWAELSYRINLPELYEGILFRIRKRGSGRAVLAEIAALAEDDCGDLPAVELAARPHGALCAAGEPGGEADSEAGGACTEGACVDQDGWMSVCGGCAESSECDGGEVCGLSSTAPVHLQLHSECVAVASRGLGERCADDAECDTGVCELGVCSTCRQDAECPAGQQCRARSLTADGHVLPRAPRQCEPEAGLGQAGAACLTGSDCQSGACTGSAQRRLCLGDSRACQQDNECPLSIFDVAGSGDTGTCVTVGAVDGFCQ